MKLNRQTKRLLAAVAVLAVGWLAQQAGVDLSALTGERGRVSAPSAAAPASGAMPESARTHSKGVAEIEAAASQRRSGFMVTVDARVVKTLPDDRDGSRHQRFLIELDSGRTLLVAHNIDLADRIEVQRGDVVRVRGQYEWNERGGVLHWTHHDPDGRHEGGWIERAGLRVE